MGMEIDSIYWKLKLKMDELDRDIAIAKGKFGGLNQSVEKETNKFAGVLKKLGVVTAAYFTGQAIGNFIKQIGSVRAEFQKYEAVLTNTLGSGSKAQDALDNIQQFASNTPFQITELTSSFVKLANQGFTPTIEEMRKLGDLASSVGKGYDQLTEGILDAATGQWERMKEFGIKAQQEGDKVTVTFKGQATTIDNTAESIRNYILSLGDMKGVAGAMEAISKTLGGQLSNLQDNIEGLMNTLGRKLEGFFSSILSGANKVIGGINKLFLGDFGDTVGKGIDKFQESLTKELSQIQVLFDAAKKSAEGTNMRKDAINQINKIYGSYLDNLLTEKSAIDDLNIAQQTLTENIIKTMAVKAQEQQLQKELNKSFADEQKQFNNVMEFISKKKGAGSQVVAQNELNKMIEDYARQGTYDSHALVEWFNKYGLDQKFTLHEIIKNMEDVIAIQKERREDISRINSFYQELTSGAGEVIEDQEKGKNKPKKEDKEKKDQYTLELEFFQKYIADMKKRYIEYKQFEKAFGISAAKEQYKGMFDSYEDFLRDMYNKVKEDREKLAIVAAEWDETGNPMPIVTDEGLAKAAKMVSQSQDYNKIQKKITEEMRKHAEQSKKARLAPSEEDIKSFAKYYDTIHEILGGLSELSDALVKMGLMSEESAEQMNKAIHNAQNAIQSKSPAEGFIKFVVQWGIDAISYYADLAEKKLKYETERYKREVEALNNDIETIDYATGIEKNDRYRESLNKINREVQDLIKKFSTLQDSTRRGVEPMTLTQRIDEINKLLAMYADLYAGSNKDDQKWIQAEIDRLDTLKDLLFEQQNLLNEYYENLTGTSVDSIIDTIRDGFEEGLSTVEDFGDDVNTIIRKALMRSFETQYLQASLQKWYNSFGKMMEDNILTESEGEAARAELEKVIEASNTMFSYYKQTMEDLGVWKDETAEQGLSGAIKGITEDTAGLLAGQMGAIRINVLEQLEVAKQAVIYQKETAVNTRHLLEIKNILTTIRNNNSVLSGRSLGR